MPKDKKILKSQYNFLHIYSNKSATSICWQRKLKISDMILKGSGIGLLPGPSLCHTLACYLIRFTLYCEQTVHFDLIDGTSILYVKLCFKVFVSSFWLDINPNILRQLIAVDLSKLVTIWSAMQISQDRVWCLVSISFRKFGSTGYYENQFSVFF